MKKRIVSLLLVGIMTASMLVGCGEQKTTDASKQENSIQENNQGTEVGTTESLTTDGDKIDVLNQSETMKLSVVCLQGYTQPDSQIEKWLEERYNLEIDVIALPGWSDAKAKVSLLMGDETQRPDMIWWWDMDADYTQWVDAGILVDVAPYMEKYTVMKDYYNSIDPGVLFFASGDEGAMYRIPGDVAEAACETLWIRQDWLDNLNLEVPKTLEELDKVLYAFTFDDPDGNGVQDTYGLGGDGYDFRSFWPWVQGSGEGRGRKDFQRDTDGSYFYGPATEDAKIWVDRVSKLYADGVITPNIVTDTDRDEEMANGGFGVTYSWVNWNNPSSAVMQSFYSTNPDAKWVAIDMVTGDNNNPQDDPASVGAWCYFGITNTCADPERAYAIWDDMATPENYIHRRFGVEGEHYIANADGSYEILVTGDGAENTSQNIGIKLFQDLFTRKDFCNIENSEETIALYEKVAKKSRDAYAMTVEKKNPSAYETGNELGTDIDDITQQYFWGVIGGGQSIDDWDSFIADLTAAGVDDVIDELTEIHGAQIKEYEEYIKK